MIGFESLEAVSKLLVTRRVSEGNFGIAFDFQSLAHASGYHFRASCRFETGSRFFYFSVRYVDGGPGAPVDQFLTWKIRTRNEKPCWSALTSRYDVKAAFGTVDKYKFAPHNQYAEKDVTQNYRPKRYIATMGTTFSLCRKSEDGSFLEDENLPNIQAVFAYTEYPRFIGRLAHDAGLGDEWDKYQQALDECASLIIEHVASREVSTGRQPSKKNSKKRPTRMKKWRLDPEAQPTSITDEAS